MEIRPTTVVKLFSGVPLNNTYSDTLYFSSLSAQSAYFGGLTPVKTFTSNYYQRVNKGQFEATHSIGMTHFQSMRYVILPQAIRNILPATGNQFIINIKDSCVLSVISVTELFFQTKSAAGATFQTFPAYFIACVIYFVLCFSITQILRKLETRMDGSETYTIYGTEPVINGADTLKRGDTR